MTEHDGTSGPAAFDPVSFLESLAAFETHERVDDAREYLVETVDEHAASGVAASVDDAGNVLATTGDPSAGAHVVLNTHVDTVPPDVPFERDGDVLRGRGTCDAGGPLAALLAGFLAVDRTVASRDDDAVSGAVTLAVTPDEETLSEGAHHLVTAGGTDAAPAPVAAIEDADAFVVGEPTGLAACTAAKGRFQGTLTLAGENAHAAEPASGTNAVAALEDALGGVRAFDDRADAPPVHDRLGAATLTPTVVDGGTATNQVPASASVVLDRRSVPPETADGFRDALLAQVREAVPGDVGVEFAFTERETPFLEAWATDETAPVVDALVDAGAAPPRPFGAATEASYFAALAPTVVFGPGVLADDDGAVAHSPREYVRATDVERGATVVADALHSLLD
ncbi:M20/M25/M40 family metallo-hydrolase [Halorubellus sp. PRR65]|uniref:M20/M25/M40 family metallo-hydrolase n=1 Tax=Halorubellus sp. PRR65 TaxID=3098148 RepID=UPI002B25A45E|nr:M20/M25/M40 family metallo-hydrolase [Halorubellus sp. PRR65]